MSPLAFLALPLYLPAMRWPDCTRLIDRIKRERPELIVDHMATGQDHYAIRVYCIRKEGRQFIRESLDTIYRPEGWRAYLEGHPEPWCRPKESFHTNALGREVDHRGEPVVAEPPAAPTITAEALLKRLITLNRSEPDWRKNPERIAELAATWGVRTKAHGVLADYEAEEVVRLSGNCHASILIARTGSGLFTSGIVARWGDGGITMEPTVGSVPYDTEFAARRAAFKELVGFLEAGRGASRHQQRRLMIEAVKERDRSRGLFD